ncbi:transposable element Tcb2 transposase [Trichonephila clavipes]|uniref:Transposable element Tcb2 transposase n=1 Tax=Trichonephila clavipes TaxID=2585209 RepID=A0A8X6RBW9_TRICX|nr:transposable element Tcb2 transposase [Trichonephila clavipes]
MQLLPWPAYSPDISPIEHVRDLVGRRLAALKAELLLRIQAILNYLPQADIQKLFDSMPRRIATPIAARAIGRDFIYMDANARSHRTLAVEELLESEDITRMDWPAYSPDLNIIEHVWDALGRRIAARLHHPENT